MMVPQAPNHDGSPQDGRTYQYGDPGQAIGTVLSITSSFGVEQFPTCTFVGTDGAAWFRHDGQYQIVSFLHAPYALEAPVSINNDPKKSITGWTFSNAQYQQVFFTSDRVFGKNANLAHAKFWIPRLLEQLERQPPLTMWGAQPRFVALAKDAVTVQQALRRDVVKPSEITVSFDNGDLVLRADAFYEARFFGEETPNVSILRFLLEKLGARSG